MVGLNGETDYLPEGKRVRTKTALGAVALTTAALVAGLGTPAQAAMTHQCHSNEKSISLPGKPDASITIDLCVWRDGGSYQATADVSWGSWAGMPGNAFDNFDVQVRLERYDKSKRTYTGDLTYYINATWSDTFRLSTGWVKGSPKGWSADGTVFYDVNNDGRGGKKWDLHGSPQIS